MNVIKKFRIEIILALFMAACGFSPLPLNAATVTVTATYTYSASSTLDSSGNWPACSATITSTCVTGFKIYQTDVTPFVVIGTLNNPTTPSGTQTFAQSFTDSSLAYGTHSVEATTLYVDSSGAAQETGYSAAATFVYSAGAPAIIILKTVTAK